MSSAIRVNETYILLNGLKIQKTINIKNDNDNNFQYAKTVAQNHELLN